MKLQTDQFKKPNTKHGLTSQNKPSIAARKKANFGILFGLLILLMPIGALSAATLQNITFNSLAGEKVQIKLSFSGPAVKPGSFTINNPARIALDFPNTSNRLNWKSKNIGIGFAKSITAIEAGNRTRVVLNLVQLIPFETSVSGNNVYLTLAGSRVASPGQKTSTPITSSAAVPGDEAIHSVTNIDFRRGSNGEGRIIITLSDANTPASTGESGRQIFIDFGNTGLPQELQQRLDVIDFATPVQYVDATRVGNRVRLAITAVGDYEYLAYNSGNTYIVEIKPLAKEIIAEDEPNKEVFTGEKLSLNFQNIEVRAVLQLIADFTNLNMVTSDSVSGSVTLRLKNVPWDQALDIILKTKGLGMRQSGNVIMVAPSEEIAAREKLELASKKQIEELEPLRTEIIQINYAKATTVAGLIKSKGTSVMSDRGSTTVDERTNVIIAVDTVDRLEDVRNLVNTLDIPIKQVLIESRIVIASNSFARDLGVRFGVSAVGNNATLTTTAGSLEGTSTIINQGVARGRPIPAPVIPPSQDDRLNVNLPALPTSGSAAGIALAILGSNALIDLELTALQVDGRGEVISNPRIITANQQEAIIEAGDEIPYQQASSSGATNVSFKKAVLALKVTPQITPDDRIILDLNVKKDSVGDIFAGVPSIVTKEITTQVLVSNGETVVLGGIYEESKVESASKVPFLGDIPFLGVLFRSTVKQEDKQELLIFVTPKIIKENLKTQ